MKIDVLQVESKEKNEFEIKYNDTLQYKAKLPFISINEPLNLEKLRSIKILDVNGNEIYTTDYKYIENFKEEFIPMKFLITGSQKFNQLLFTSDKNIIKIYSLCFNLCEPISLLVRAKKNDPFLYLETIYLYAMIYSHTKYM